MVSFEATSHECRHTRSPSASGRNALKFHSRASSDRGISPNEHAAVHGWKEAIAKLMVDLISESEKPRSWWLPSLRCLPS